MDPARDRVRIFCATEQCLWHWRCPQLGQLKQHPPARLAVTFSLTDGVFQRSSTWASGQLGNPIGSGRDELSPRLAALVGISGLHHANRTARVGRRVSADTGLHDADRPSTELRLALPVAGTRLADSELATKARIPIARRRTSGRARPSSVEPAPT